MANQSILAAFERMWLHIVNALGNKSDISHNHDSINGNAATATKWVTARTINGMSIDGSANRTNYGTCSTSASTVSKTVSCTGFTLITGAEITVKFTNGNTASNPTLNVNSTGAKSIYYKGTNIVPSYLKAKCIYTFRYNGTQWEVVGDMHNNDYLGVNRKVNLALDTNHTITEDGLVTIEGLITSTQYSAVWLKINGCRTDLLQQEESGGKTMRACFTRHVYAGDIVVGNATAGGSLVFIPSSK